MATSSSAAAETKYLEAAGAQLVLYPQAGHGFLFQFPERSAATFSNFCADGRRPHDTEGTCRCAHPPATAEGRRPTARGLPRSAAASRSLCIFAGPRVPHGAPCWCTAGRPTTVTSKPSRELLVDLGYLCVLPDLPAHGRSDGETMTIPEAAEALVQVGQAHGPFELCVAHSMGSAIALVAVSKGLRAGKVAFLAPPANYVHQLSLSARMAGAPDRLTHAALEVLRSRCPELDGIDSLAMAGHLTMPGLIVVAGRDEVLDPEDGRTLASAWPSSRLVELSEASHRSILREARNDRRDQRAGALKAAPSWLTLNAGLFQHVVFRVPAEIGAD